MQFKTAGLLENIFYNILFTSIYVSIYTYIYIYTFFFTFTEFQKKIFLAHYIYIV